MSFHMIVLHPVLSRNLGHCCKCDSLVNSEISKHTGGCHYPTYMHRGKAIGSVVVVIVVAVDTRIANSRGLGT